MDAMYDIFLRTMWVLLAIAVGGAVVLVRTKGPTRDDVGVTKKKKPKKKKQQPIPATPTTPVPPEPPSEPSSAKAAFEEGEKVEALWNGESWHPGTLRTVKPLGAGEFSYAVDYDDGEFESRLDASRLRRISAAPRVQQKTVTPTDVPDLSNCVAYRKDGLPDVVDENPPTTTRRLRRRLQNNLPDAVPDDDDDDFDVGVVQSEAEWRAAAPKPRKPKVAKPPPEKKKEVSNTEKNRKKREKQKSQKLAVREALRAA